VRLNDHGNGRHTKLPGLTQQLLDNALMPLVNAIEFADGCHTARVPLQESISAMNYIHGPIIAEKSGLYPVERLLPTAHNRVCALLYKIPASTSAPTIITNWPMKTLTTDTESGRMMMKPKFITVPSATMAQPKASNNIIYPVILRIPLPCTHLLTLFFATLQIMSVSSRSDNWISAFAGVIMPVLTTIESGLLCSDNY
jgi:hypothetical protein